MASNITNINDLNKKPEKKEEPPFLNAMIGIRVEDLKDPNKNYPYVEAMLTKVVNSLHVLPSAGNVLFGKLDLESHMPDTVLQITNMAIEDGTIPGQQPERIVITFKVQELNLKPEETVDATKVN